jgi:hypothetical protein
MFEQTVRGHDIPGISVYDRTGETPSAWDVDRTPTIYLVDAEGVLRYASDPEKGLPTEEGLEEKIDGLLRQKK